MAATKLGIQTQPSATYLSEVALGQSPVFLAQNSGGSTDTGSSAIVTITPSVPSSRFNLPWASAEPIATTHTVVAGSTTSVIIVSPALSFPAIIGTADYTGKGFTCYFPADNPFHGPGDSPPGRGMLSITSNTGTTQINLASPAAFAPTVGETISIHSGYEFNALSAVCASGVATFPTFSISGNAATALVATSSGLTGITTNSITNAGTYYRGAELPRITPDTTYPVTIGAQYTVGSGKTYSTVQAAYDAAVAANLSTAIELLIDPGTYAEQIHLKKKTNAGEIIFRRAGSHVQPVGTRVQPSDFALGGVKISIENTRGVAYCDDGACYVRFCGIEICQPVPAGGTNTEILSVLYLAQPDGSDFTDPTTYPHHMIVDRCYVHGGTGIEIRKGIVVGGPYMSVVDSDVRDIFELHTGIHQFGDNNAIAVYYSPGPHKFDNCHFNASGEVVLFGGADSPIPGLVTSDITITRCLIEKPLAWKGVYESKNNFELKSARRLLVEGCIFDGSYAAGQDGTGMVMGSANQSQSPANGFEGIRDVVLRKSFLRNMTAGFTFIGENFNYAYTQRRVVMENLVAANLHWNEPTVPNTDINRLMYLGSGLADVVLDHLTLLAQPGVPTTGLYFTTLPNARMDVTNSILTASGGVIKDNFGAGAAAIAAAMPSATFAKNLLIDRAADGVSYPAASYYPATNADVGFTTIGITSTWNTADPDTVCAALALAAATTYKGLATDATDPGANMTTVRAAIAGVWNGTAGGGGGGGTTGPAWLIARFNRDQRH